MKTKYKWIHFKLLFPANDKRKTSIWEVLSNDDDEFLGYIKWYPAWRRYCHFTELSDAIFDQSCYRDIIDFIQQLEEARQSKEIKSQRTYEKHP